MREVKPLIPPQALLYRKRQRTLMAFLISFVLIIMSILLSFGRDGETGVVTIDPITIILGIFVASLIFLALIPKNRDIIPTIPCHMCKMPIPIDGIYCPYCGYENRKII